MPRTTGTVASHRRRKRLLKRAKGYRGARSKQLRTAISAVIRAGAYAYRDRRTKRRNLRRLWITRLSAACRMRGTRYSRFINGLQHAGVLLNRKMLSEIAIYSPADFDAIAKALDKGLGS